MCNRFRVTVGETELATRFGAESICRPEKGVPGFETGPKQAGWVVRNNRSRRVLDVMTWGFPHQVRSAGGKIVDRPVTNVGTPTGPFWRSLLANPERRCLIPASEFSVYASARSADGKIPLHSFNLPGREIFALGGVWRPTPNGNVFAFATSAPNDVVRPIGRKAMPLILGEEHFDGWLSGSYDSLSALIAPYPSQLMAVVS